MVIAPRIGLLNEQSVVLHRRSSPPCLVAPCMVCPADAERKVGFATFNNLIERSFEELFSPAEPVMIVAEALYPCLPCQHSLLLSGLRKSQVVETKVGGYAWLSVSTEQRLGLSHVSPLRKTTSPPEVVLRYGVELRQV